MRILLVTDWPDEGGGVETYLDLVARGLRDAGDEVRLLTSSVGGGPAVADYVAFGSRNLLLQTVLQVANPAAARTLRRAVAEFKPDVLFVAMFEMHLSPSVLEAAGDVPIVLCIAYYKPICPNGLKLLPDNSICTVQPGTVCWRGGCCSLGHWLRDRVRYTRIDRGIRAATSVLSCSRWLQRRLAESGIDSNWFPWPVAPSSATFQRTPADQPLFAFVGRFAREKGVDTLLHAVAQVRRQNPEVRLRLVGDGPDRSELERLVVELGLADAVEFVGWIPAGRVEVELADAWALIAPSRWAEPLGLTALEAIVRGIPVIASTTGGYAETVEAGKSGLLFPNGDIDALAACLTSFCSGDRFGIQVPPEVVEHIRQEHDLDRHVARLREVFARVAA